MLTSIVVTSMRNLTWRLTKNCSPARSDHSSGLSDLHRIVAEGGIPPLHYDFEREKWALAERFGKYGLKSEVDIRQLWPSIEEIEEIQALRMFRTAKEAKKIADERIRGNNVKREQRLKKIEAKWEEHDQLLAEFYQKESKESQEKLTEEQELEMKVREVQEYFGYWVDPKDPRFRLMLQQKEENLKLEARLAKKEKKKS